MVASVAWAGAMNVIAVKTAAALTNKVTLISAMEVIVAFMFLYKVL
jgi:hypothetical protein